MRHVGRMSAAEVLFELGEILAALKAFDQIAPRPFLVMGQRREHPVLFEQPDDVG